MPKVKLPRKGTRVDMTAMCDVAFLLLTFFMLATKFKPIEPIVIRTSASTSSIPIPPDHILLSLSKDGRVFFSTDNLDTREQLIQNISDDKNLGLNAAQIKNFREGGAIGVPFNRLPSYLNLSVDERAAFDKTAPGIPADTSADFTSNELAYWIRSARYIAPQARIAIKADGDALYPEIQKIISTLGKQKIFRFNFITETKGVPPGTALAEQVASGALQK